MSKFTDRLKSFGKEILAFVTSPVVLKNVGLMIAVVIALLFVMLGLMKGCTRHGESLQVEDYTGMRYEDAIRKAKGANFRVVLNDSIDRGELPPNVVFAQNPEPLSKVKKNRTIYLTITKKERNQETLPSLKGRDEFDRYASDLKTKGIEARIKERVMNDRYAPNTILNIYYEDKKIAIADIEKGYKVPRGAVMYFDVTERSDNYTAIPDLVCDQFERAQFLIKSYQLVVGDIVADPTVTDRATAFVYKQIPEFNATQKIRVGQQINLYLTQTRPADCPLEDLFSED